MDGHVCVAVWLLPLLLFVALGQARRLWACPVGVAVGTRCRLCVLCAGLPRHRCWTGRMIVCCVAAWHRVRPPSVCDDHVVSQGGAVPIPQVFVRCW